MDEASHRTQIITDTVAAKSRGSSGTMQDGMGDEPGVATALEWSCVAGREDVSGETERTMVVSGGRHDR